LDEKGKGVVYSYDPVGHVEKHTYRAGGSSVALLQPLLDNQVGLKNLANVDKNKKINLKEATELVHDLFISATEREIHTGDKIAMKIITKDGVQERTIGLRKD
jgi:20S proteasome subunit beta 6